MSDKRRAIGGLIAVLRRFKIEADDGELADWMWYAALQTSPSARHAEKAAQAEQEIPQGETKKQPPARRAETFQGDPRLSAGVYSKQAAEEHEQKKGDGLPFRAPGGRALPHTLAISRALRPLMRRVPSADGFILNEEATAQQIAQSDVWLPVFKKKSVRWLEVILVIEDSPSMRLWHHTVRELREVLEQQGAFRDVRTRILRASSEEAGLYAEDGQTQVNYKELINRSRQRLILAVTDCISSAWRNETLHQWLDAWGNTHPLTIVQMLPQRLWPRTCLRNMLIVTVAASGPALPNALLKSADVSSPRPGKASDKSKKPAHPLLTLEPGFVENWAGFVAGTGDIAVPACILKAEKRGTVLSQTGPDENKRLQKFRAAASPTAFRLAIYLAAAPLRLPVMRLVQRVMLPQSDQVHLAEFFLSGLIKPAAHNRNISNPDEIDYEFYGKLRGKLLDMGLLTDALSVQETVSDYIAEHYGSTVDFQALIANPADVESSRVASGHEKFATVTREVLSRLGSEYIRVLDELSEFPLFRDRLKDGSEGPDMRTLPGGVFSMGDEAFGPVHQVTLNRFSIGRYPVTFEKYDLFCEATEREKPDDHRGRGKMPVIYVSWNDAAAYCEWLSEQTGQKYRLLTEAEWEYACRAGSDAAYCFGDDKNRLAEYAWHGEDFQKGGAHPAGEKEPNAFGLHDMHGNVWEWMQDWYEEYPEDAQTDPKGPDTGSDRVIRGGSWGATARSCHSAMRNWYDPDVRNNYLGFRLARAYPQPSCPFTPPEMLRIPPGRFRMGDIQRTGFGNERPVHEVTLGGFEIGKYPVTVREFKVFIEERDYRTEAETGNGAWVSGGWGKDANWRNPYLAQDDSHPVVCISWNDAAAYCDWLCKRTGENYRLPTEAEWEYACRAGSETAYCFGDDEKEIGDYAWHLENSAGNTHPVGEKKPNAWGLYDVHGNVLEWVYDWYGPYPEEAQTDPKGPETGPARVIRGGSWFNSPRGVRSADRSGDDPGDRLDDVGFRPVRAYPQPSSPYYPSGDGADSRGGV
ncbi:MAG: formylglycine-generating enzyme family protein [Gammaproteobacteria bacterium]|nr:formylglycine-generating enzyme family protein [Gammaproteobacteria bacterium]